MTTQNNWNDFNDAEQQQSGFDLIPKGAIVPVRMTLRKWACLENGPIRPVRINGRLAWHVSDLQKLLQGDA